MDSNSVAFVILSETKDLLLLVSVRELEAPCAFVILSEAKDLLFAGCGALRFPTKAGVVLGCRQPSWILSEVDDEPTRCRWTDRRQHRYPTQSHRTPLNGAPSSCGRPALNSKEVLQRKFVLASEVVQLKTIRDSKFVEDARHVLFNGVFSDF